MLRSHLYKHKHTGKKMGKGGKKQNFCVIKVHIFRYKVHIYLHEILKAPSLEPRSAEVSLTGKLKYSRIFLLDYCSVEFDLNKRNKTLKCDQPQYD